MNKNNDGIDEEANEIVQQSVNSVNKVWPILAEELVINSGVAINLMLTINARFLNGLAKVVSDEMKMVLRYEYIKLINEKLGDGNVN